MKVLKIFSSLAIVFALSFALIPSTASAQSSGCNQFTCTSSYTTSCYSGCYYPRPPVNTYNPCTCYSYPVYPTSTNYYPTSTNYYPTAGWYPTSYNYQQPQQVPGWAPNAYSGNYGSNNGYGNGYGSNTGYYSGYGYAGGYNVYGSYNGYYTISSTGNYPGYQTSWH